MAHHIDNLLQDHLKRTSDDMNKTASYNDTLELLRMDIKEEIDNHTNYIENHNLSMGIKTEREGIQSAIPVHNHNENPNNPFENVQLEVKQEVNISMILENDDSAVTTENNFETTENTHTESCAPNVNIRKITVKEESQTDDSLVSYDYPNFDDVSMNSNETADVASIDSYDTVALRNVEACLQDEINIKCENEANYESEKFNHANVKTESDLTVVTARNKPTSTAATTEVGLPKNAVVKLPENGVLGNHGEILSTYDANDNADAEASQFNSTGDESAFHCNNMDGMEGFQLNSITGNVMSLEQEAYGLLKAKSNKKIHMTPKKLYTCTECPKTYTIASSLQRHWAVHRTIERRTQGRLRGLQTRKDNKKRKLITDNLRENRKKKTVAQTETCGRTRNKSKKEGYECNTIAQTESCDRTPNKSKKEGYECTCGKAYRRRSRMETCLRSHNLFQSDIKCVPCVTCSKSFKNKDELSLHRKRLHRKRFPCKFCPTDYETRKELFKHLQIHQKVQLMEYKVISEVMKGKKLRCFMCSKSWTELSELKSHVLIDHKEPYICPHCKNTFTKIIDFGNHTKVYHPEVEGQSVLDVLEAFSKLIKAWKCQECGQQFLEADKLALHQIESHSPELRNETQFQCTDCRRVFVTQKGLTSHRRVHHSTESTEESKEEIQGIMCLECRKMCKDMTALTSHMRLHSPERKYPCKFCDFRFATPEKRKSHADIHTGDMKYVCFICEYQCSSENRLRQHKMSLKHANIKEYLLTGKPLLEESPSTSKETKEECKKKEGSVKKRKRDRVSDKEDKSSSEDIEEVSCDICGDKFSSEEEMLEHKLTHPFIEFPNDDKPSRIFFR